MIRYLFANDLLHSALYAERMQQLQAEAQQDALLRTLDPTWSDARRNGWTLFLIGLGVALLRTLSS
jgi:hypothetical protein